MDNKQCCRFCLKPFKNDVISAIDEKLRKLFLAVTQIDLIASDKLSEYSCGFCISLLESQNIIRDRFILNQHYLLEEAMRHSREESFKEKQLMPEVKDIPILPQSPKLLRKDSSDTEDGEIQYIPDPRQEEVVEVSDSESEKQMQEEFEAEKNQNDEFIPLSEIKVERLINPFSEQNQRKFNSRPKSRFGRIGFGFQKDNQNSSKNAKCRFCSRTFSSDLLLSYHMRDCYQTNSARNVQCPYCPRSFYTKSQTNSHISFYHMKAYLCCEVPQCEQICYRREYYRNHIRMKHNDLPFESYNYYMNRVETVPMINQICGQFNFI